LPSKTGIIRHRDGKLSSQDDSTIFIFTLLFLYGKALVEEYIRILNREE
jgi:hypothetical protein